MALALAGCSHAGEYFWVDTLPVDAPADAEYRVEEGDVITVRVYQQEAMSVDRARVRDDGRISMPMLQDVEVAGMTPADISRRVGAKLKSYVVNPVVTVSVLERHPVRVSVVGEVGRPGVYDLDRGAGVLHAIAAAGGLAQYAHRDRIFLLRHGHWADGNPAPARIRFSWDALVRGERHAASFALRAGDLLVVE